MQKQKTILDLIPKRIIDQKAFTTAEMCELQCASESTISRILKEHIANGEAEQVWKKVNGRVVPAYRLKTK